MSHSIKTESLSMARQILRARLIRESSFGASIINQGDITNSTIEDHPGTMIGYFAKRQNNHPCFILIRRQGYSDLIHSIYAFYINTKCIRIQPTEMKPLKKLASNINDPDLTTAVINIQTQVDLSSYLSLLIETVEYYLDPKLLEQLDEKLIIRARRRENWLCFRKDLGYPTCTRHSNDDISHNKYDIITNSGLKLMRNCSIDNLPDNCNDFLVLQILFDNHYIYAIRKPNTRSIVILLTHCAQFTWQDEFDRFSRAIRTKYKVNKLIPCRYYGSFDTSCDSHIIIKAARLIAIFLPCTLLTIKENDVRAFEGGFWPRLVSHLQPGDGVQDEIEPLTEHNLVLQDEPSNDDTTVILELKGVVLFDVHAQSDLDDYDCTIEIDNPLDGPVYYSRENNDTQSSSQNTIIMSEQEINSEIRLQQQFSEWRIKLSHRIPYPDFTYAADDIEGLLLKDRHYFLYRFMEICAKWKAYATTRVAEGIVYGPGPIELEQFSERFYLIPLFIQEMMLVIIIDLSEQHWAVLSGNNYNRGDAIYQSLISNIVSMCPQLAGMTNSTIMLTSHFHREYELIHILLAMHKIGQYFKYAVRIPQKVIYSEADFRWLCVGNNALSLTDHADQSLFTQLAVSLPIEPDTSVVSHYKHTSYHASADNCERSNSHTCNMNQHRMYTVCIA